MSARACVYKGCPNYNLQRVQGNAVSLFKFPKNPLRCKKWMDLGKAPHNLPEYAYYYCSNHFETKFLSRNKRRTLLVGEAIPIAYEGQNFERLHERVQLSLDDGENNTYVLVEEISESPNIEKQQRLHVESTTAKQDNTCSNEEKNNVLNKSFIDERGSRTCEIEASEKKGIKTDASDYGEPKKRKFVPTISPTQEDISLKKSGIISQMDEEKGSIILLESCETTMPPLINTEHISAFTFKGEEFVQMSKAYYINEKKAFLKKIQQLESVLNAVKDQILTIDF